MSYYRTSKRNTRRDGGFDGRWGNYGNKGNRRGHYLVASDESGHSVSECWELLFIMNAQAPAPYKFADEELEARMYELFPRKREEGVHAYDSWRAHLWRMTYNYGQLYQQRARNPDLLPEPPPQDLYSWRYVRIPAPDEPGKWPYHVVATTASGKVRFSVYPPEPHFRYEKLKFMFNIPKQDWSEFPFPKEAKNLYRDIKRERLEAERLAFQEFCTAWMAKQKALRPQDFDPLLWKDPKW